MEVNSVRFTTYPWYNCLAWAFSQILCKQLPYKFRKYVLNSKLPITTAFEQKALELGLRVKQVEQWEYLEAYESGFIVYGYFLEELREGYHTSYEKSGFHVVLWNNHQLAHQNGCGVTPTSTTMGELQKMGYTYPKYFAVISNKQD